MVGLGSVQCWVGWRVQARLVSSQTQGVRGWLELVRFRRRSRMRRRWVALRRGVRRRVSLRAQVDLVWQVLVLSRRRLRMRLE